MRPAGFAVQRVADTMGGVLISKDQEDPKRQTACCFASTRELFPLVYQRDLFYGILLPVVVGGMVFCDYQFGRMDHLTVPQKLRVSGTDNPMP